MSLVRDALGLSPRLRRILDAGPGDPQALFAQTNTVAHTDTTAKTLFDLPADAVIVDIVLNVTTAFNDGTTDNLDVGHSTTNGFYGTQAVGTAGQRLTGWTNLGPVGTDRTVTATYSGGGTATAGQATVTVLYLTS